MTFKYDKQLDIIRILFDSSAVVEESEEQDGIILDRDSFGRPIGIEILDAASRMEIANDIGKFLNDAVSNQQVASR